MSQAEEDGIDSDNDSDGWILVDKFSSSGKGIAAEP
jgi:hypothetical protein